MISLDQVQLLEKKVAAIVAKMNELQKQNSYLLAQNKDLVAKNEELSAKSQILMQKVSSFEADQNRIEQGIMNALEKLNSMENDAVNSFSMQESENYSQFSQQNDSPVAIETSEVSENEDNFQNSSEAVSVNENALENEEKSEEPKKDDVFDFGIDLTFDDISDDKAKPDIF